MESTSGATFESRNPADRADLVGTFQQGTAADVAMAIRAADVARPDWRATPAPRRGEILFEYARLLRRDKERLARHLTREMGGIVIVESVIGRGTKFSIEFPIQSPQ